MKPSPLFDLNKRDFLRGLVMAVLTAILTAFYKLIEDGGAFNQADMLTVSKVAIGAAIAYLLKNFFTRDQPAMNSSSERNSNAG